MTKESILSLCAIISGSALIASAANDLPGQVILALCCGAFIGILIGVDLLEARYKDLYKVANTTPRNEDVLSSSYSDIPSFVTKFSDFREIVCRNVDKIGKEALIKQNDSIGAFRRSRMLMLMLDQAVKDCAGVWLRREGRENLRISIDNVMHVYMEWTDVESDKETNEHADDATHT